MMHGSAFVDRMRSGGLYVPGIEYTNIVTRYDEIVVPYTSGIEPGPQATNIVCRTAANRTTRTTSRSRASGARGRWCQRLDPAHQREVPCVFVPPIAG